MFILMSCRLSTMISVHIMSRNPCSLSDVENGDNDSVPSNLGLDCTEQSGLSNDVVALAGVPLHDCSWLAMGVISVPMSCIDTDTTAGAARSTDDRASSSLLVRQLHRQHLDLQIEQPRS
jgi:hypothetical protein